MAVWNIARKSKPTTLEEIKEIAKRYYEHWLKYKTQVPDERTGPIDTSEEAAVTYAFMDGLQDGYGYARSRYDNIVNEQILSAVKLLKRQQEQGCSAQIISETKAGIGVLGSLSCYLSSTLFYDGFGWGYYPSAEDLVEIGCPVCGDNGEKKK